jgi:hypothetical protein
MCWSCTPCIRARPSKPPRRHGVILLVALPLSPLTPTGILYDVASHSCHMPGDHLGRVFCSSTVSSFRPLSRHPNTASQPTCTTTLKVLPVRWRVRPGPSYAITLSRLLCQRSVAARLCRLVVSPRKISSTRCSPCWHSSIAIRLTKYFFFLLVLPVRIRISH